LAIPAAVRRVKGHSSHLGRAGLDVRKTLAGGRRHSTGAGLGRLWKLSQASQG